MRFKNNNAASLSKKLVGYSVAAGVVAVGAASPAQGALQVFDHTSAPLGVGYDANRNMAVLYMDGTFKLHTDGIIEADKTDDAIWFKCLDFMASGSMGYKGYTGLFAYTGSGAGVAAHTYSGDVGGAQLYEVEHANNPDIGLEATETEVHSGLTFTNGDAVMRGAGGASGSPGWGGSTSFTDRKGFWGRGFVGFTLEEPDGAHYGWADVGFAFQPLSMSIFGWGYQSTPGMAAELTYDVPPAAGDFDDDGDIDAADVDILCDNMGSLDPQYDLDDGSGNGNPDGVVDENDMIYHVEHLVELTDGSGRVGTKRGDFNLDGLIDGTDLALMKTAFGQPNMNYADGNANCDAFVNGTDLAILKTNFGFIAPTGGGVPEPATLSLLALGATGLAAKRRRKS